MGCTLAELGERLPAAEFPIWAAYLAARRAPLPAPTTQTTSSSGQIRGDVRRIRGGSQRLGTRGVLRDPKQITEYLMALCNV